MLDREPLGKGRATRDDAPAFDRIYVINLPHRTDRRREMAAELEKLGLSFASPSVHLFEAVRPDDAGPFPTVGTRGCFLSHLGVLQDASRRGCRSVLVLEDDVDFSSDAARRLEAGRRAIATSAAAMLYGGHRLELPAAAEGWVALPPTDAVETAHCVAFHGEAIARCADYLAAMLDRPAGDPAGGPMHVDGAYAWFRRERPTVRTLAATPSVAGQRSSRTDIHALPWFDRLPLVRSLAGVARALRRSLHRRIGS